MKRIAALGLILFCSACATREAIYVPQKVDVPVELPCKPAVIEKPTDLLLALPANSSLTLGTKTCLAQHDYDLGYQAQLEASIAACQ